MHITSYHNGTNVITSLFSDKRWMTSLSYVKFLSKYWYISELSIMFHLSVSVGLQEYFNHKTFIAFPKLMIGSNPNYLLVQDWLCLFEYLFCEINIYAIKPNTKLKSYGDFYYDAVTLFLVLYFNLNYMMLSLSSHGLRKNYFIEV